MLGEVHYQGYYIHYLHFSQVVLEAVLRWPSAIEEDLSIDRRKN